jgi:zinc metalloprotease ZmpB
MSHGLGAAAARAALLDRPGARFAVREDDAGGPPRTLRGFSGVTLDGWGRDRRAAVEALFDSEAARFRARPGLDRFVVSSERERGGVHHLRAEQTFRGIPVFGAQYAVAVGAAGDLRMIAGRAVAGVDVADVRPRLGVERATRRAAASLGASLEAFATRLVVFRAPRGSDHLAWEIRAEDPRTRRHHLALVDAHDGEVLDTQDLSFDLTGRGNVYPVSDKDPLSYVERPLPRLRGPTALTGDHVQVHDWSGNDAVGVDGHFPSDTSRSLVLTQTSAYWHLDHFFARVRELGFAADLRAVAYVNGVDPPDNCSIAFANPAANAVYFFLPCLRLNRNMGNAADVLYHEAQHLVTSSYGIWGSELESRAIHEGYADYMACTLTDDPNFAEWALVPCDRNVAHGGAARWLDSDKSVFHYSRRDRVFACYAGFKDPHAVGMILSGAMWDLRTAIGADAADRLAIEALDYLPVIPDFGCVADAFLQANYDHHGGRHSIDVLRAFLDRGIRGAATVEISGPSSLLAGVPGTFRAVECCGVGSGTLSWSRRPPCDVEPCPEWTEIGQGEVVELSSEGDFDLRLTSMDRWGRAAFAQVRIPVYVGPGPTVEIAGPLSCNRSATYTVNASGTPPLTIYWQAVHVNNERSDLGTGWSIVVECARLNGVRARVVDYAGREAIDYLKFGWGAAASASWALELEPPAAGATAFAITAPFEERIELAIHDVAGRVVARPFAGRMAAGRTRLEWRHAAARPGLYFARLRTLSGTLVRKVVVTN